MTPENFLQDMATDLYKEIKIAYFDEKDAWKSMNLIGIAKYLKYFAEQKKIKIIFNIKK